MKKTIKNFENSLGAKNLLSNANKKNVLGGNTKKGGQTFTGTGPAMARDNPDA